MKKIVTTFSVFFIVMANTAMARIWRVNNDVAKGGDFTTISAAVTAASAGDTIHIEPSPTPYGAFILNKKLVILGNGYFLGGAGLQADQDSSMVNSMTIDSSSVTSNGSGSFVSGITFLTTSSIIHNVRDITITRCLFTGQLNIVSYDRSADGISISQCFLQSNILGTSTAGNINISFENNIFSTATGMGFGSMNLDAHFGGLFRNNTFNNTATALTLSGFYIANNVFTSNNLTDVNAGNNIVRDNTFAAVAVINLVNGQDGNQLGILMAPLFTGSLVTGHGDTRFQTAGPGALRGSGETIGGITPDRGAYNTVTLTDSYRSSGIPAIPTIYVLTVPASISPAATSMNITISTRSNN